jgi:hypothetical protein
MMVAQSGMTKYNMISNGDFDEVSTIPVEVEEVLAINSVGCCSHTGQVELSQNLLKDVMSCFEQTSVDVELMTIYEDYLLHQDYATMVSQTPLGCKYMPLSILQDRLGWDCFLRAEYQMSLLQQYAHSFSGSQLSVGVQDSTSLCSVLLIINGCFEMLTFRQV